MQTIITIVAAIFVFAVVIFIHELGHFIFAKMFKVRVNEFAIGMGPKLVKKQVGETLYSIRAVPFGGFCDMDGEDQSSSSSNAFNNKPVWQRAIILLAGAVFNIVLGFLIYLIILGSHSTVDIPKIGAITPNSPMAISGVQLGDEIVKLNDTKINIYDDVSFFLQRIEGSPINVAVNRHGEKETFVATPILVDDTYSYFSDRIEYIMKTKDGVELSKTVITDDETLSKYADKAGDVETNSRYFLGFSPTKIENSFGMTIKHAFYNTILICKVVYTSLIDLITGRVSVSKMSGPIGIIDTISSATKAGFMTLLSFIAMITINLGVFNLLPIPALDGGRLVFLAVEGIRRKPIPPEKEGLVHMIGFALLILLILFVSYHDIVRIFVK